MRQCYVDVDPISFSSIVAGLHLVIRYTKIDPYDAFLRQAKDASCTIGIENTDVSHYVDFYHNTFPNVAGLHYIVDSGNQNDSSLFSAN